MEGRRGMVYFSAAMNDLGRLAIMMAIAVGIDAACSAMQ